MKFRVQCLNASAVKLIFVFNVRQVQGKFRTVATRYRLDEEVFPTQHYSIIQVYYCKHHGNSITQTHFWWICIFFSHKLIMMHSSVRAFPGVELPKKNFSGQKCSGIFSCRQIFSNEKLFGQIFSRKVLRQNRLWTKHVFEQTSSCRCPEIVSIMS